MKAMPAACASRGACGVDLLAGELDAAPVALVDAAEDVHGGRLAGAVLADEAEHVAGLQLEADIPQYRNAEEALVEVLDAKQRFGSSSAPDDHAVAQRVGDGGEEDDAALDGIDRGQ